MVAILQHGGWGMARNGGLGDAGCSRMKLNSRYMIL